MIAHSLASFLILTATLVVNAQAASREETSKDWTAGMAEINTGEDIRKTCSAWTTAKDAGGAAWTLRLAISNGDVLPPEAYPQVSLIAASGLPKGENLSLSFDFGDAKVDVKAMGDGDQLMINNEKETSLALLKNLAAGSTVTAMLGGKPTPALSLAGFTASYRKLGNWCGFPTTDVAK